MQELKLEYTTDHLESLEMDAFSGYVFPYNTRRIIATIGSPLMY